MNKGNAQERATQHTVANIGAANFVKHAAVIEQIRANIELNRAGKLRLTEVALDGSFVARRLARSEVIACASPEYLDKHGRPQHPRDLAKHEAMLPNFLHELTFHAVNWNGEDSATESVTLPVPRPALSTIHTDTMYAAALAGMGITGLPSFVAEDALLENALERVLPQWRLLSTTLYAGMPTRKHVPARTRAFVDFLVQTFGGEDRDPWLLAAGCETQRRGAPEKVADEAQASLGFAS